MDSAVLHQLVELANAFNRIGLKPVICGGVGIYLLFQDRSYEIRATSDIDLMIPHSQAVEEAQREAIAELITGGLKYVVCEDGRCFRFSKEPGQQLDILAPPIKEVTTEGERVKLVRSRLHGRLTPEACFIEEDLRTVDLVDLTSELRSAGPLLVSVPSPTNILILKLFAFADRDSDARRNEAHAQAHAYDVYLVAALALPGDYQEGRRFLTRHATSHVVQRTRTIIGAKFSTLEQSGWRHVLASSAFYPGRPMQARRERLDIARRRLLRWFEEQGLT
ncbi:MAG: hypothetical protein A2Y76_12685 [Planctomycetes bacterium RBG_13_60_9]|nr:MAG: hypothetical protein A2Y76_12685 [Planctomycetes bacterium RBG_13_60_9]